MKINLSIILFLLTFATANSQALSPRIANYDIQVELDTDNRKTRASQTLLWRNPSGDVVNELQFHLYYNAFKNNKTTFFNESRRTGFGELEIDDCAWSWSKVTYIKDQYGNDLTATQEYIQPDDGNEYDLTVLRVPLAQPVQPYDSIRLEMKWEAKIPKLMVRTGYNQDYYFMAQWFPKVGVYEPAGTRFAKEGQWNCHQYHANTEYYSDFGIYKVAINTPKEYVVGASGSMIAESFDGDRKTSTFYVEDVIDFTWTAYPDFEEEWTEWNDVKIRLLRHPDRASRANKYLDAAKNSFEYLDKHVGKYPYKTLTIVDPPFHGASSSAMEYPTLITGVGLGPFPEGIRSVETITVHELVHQYFMQMIATNEQEEPWMDEGFTAYIEYRIIDHYYKNFLESNWFDFQTTSKDWRRMRYFALSNPKIDEIGQFGWHFKHGGYHDIIYSKTALMLSTLEGLVGLETMDKILQTYFEKWKFKHPGQQDFINVVNEVVTQTYGDKFGENMDWFFEQMLMGTNICDYAVASISNIKEVGAYGFVDGEDCIQPDENITASYNSQVIVHRLGEVKLPIEMRVVFDDGSEVMETWDGQERSFEFNYTGTKKVDCAEIDPFYKIPLDKNYINNSKTNKQKTTGIWKYVSSWMMWIQQTMESVSLLV